MDKAEIKLILQSFHPGQEDDHDPLLREAFERMAGDPELAAWFQAEQEFDSVMVKKFANVPVELSVKERLLHELRPNDQSASHAK